MMFSIKDTKIDKDSKIYLSSYATTATADKLTISIEDLQQKIANKLNSNPVDHKHTIQQIEQLEQSLNNKLSIPSSDESKYSYNTLLKDWQNIQFLENVKIPQLDISPNSTSSGYIFSADATGDLLITNNDIIIAQYNKAANKWNLNSISDVLINHYEVLNIILDKLCLKDAYTTDGNKITPTEKA